MSTDKSASFLEGRKRAIAFHNYMVSNLKRIREKYIVAGALTASPSPDAATDQLSATSIPAAEPPTSLEAATDQLSAVSIPAAEQPPSLEAATDQLSAASIPVEEPPLSLDNATGPLPVATTASQLRRKRKCMQYPNRVKQAAYHGNVTVHRKQSQSVQHELVWQMEEELLAGHRTPVHERDESLNTTVEHRGIGIMQILASTLWLQVAQQQEFRNSQSMIANSPSVSEWNLADEASSKQDGRDESVEFANAESFPVTMIDPPDYSLKEDGYFGLAFFNDL
jgi:hypothetical protein